MIPMICLLVAAAMCFAGEPIWAGVVLLGAILFQMTELERAIRDLARAHR